MTTISSRERPRGRGAAAIGPQASPKTHTRVGSAANLQQEQQQQQYGAPQAAHYMHQGQPPGSSYYHSHLNSPSALYRNSRSLDSGLDEFGAVPFAVAPPSPQTRAVHAPRAQTEAAPQVRKDGCIDSVGRYCENFASLFLILMIC